MTGSAAHCEYCADDETDAERGLVIAELAAQAAEDKLDRIAALHPKELCHGWAGSFGSGDEHYRCGRCQPHFESGRWPCPTMAIILAGAS